MLPHSHTPKLLTPGGIDPHLWQILSPPSARWGIKLDLWDQMEFFPPLNHPLFGANVPAVVFILLLVVLHGLLDAVAPLLSVFDRFSIMIFHSFTLLLLLLSGNLWPTCNTNETCCFLMTSCIRITFFPEDCSRLGCIWFPCKIQTLRCWKKIPWGFNF